MKRIRSWIAVGVVTAALAAGGIAASAATSSHGAATMAEPALVSAVNSVCRGYATKIEEITAPSFTPTTATAADLAAAATYLGKVVPLEQAEQRAVDASGRPSADGPLYASVLSALSARVADEAAAGAAAKARSLAGFRTAYTRDQADSTRLAGLSQQFGLTSCA
jgi:hypothetical protein